ncbi:MAG: amidase [Verrucomicrobia bacterium]|nr:amidase [Verrucomicrobiota bacterium]
MRRSLLLVLALVTVAVTRAAAPFVLEEASIESIQKAILEKQLTSSQLVRAYLTRIKAYNGTAVKEPNGILGVIETIPHAGKINSLGTLNLRPAALREWGFPAKMARSLTDSVDNNPAMPDALEVAAAQDAAFAKTGKLVGPLLGVVMAIKDQYDTADMRTTANADVPYANDRPPVDATFIKRLREAGAIILAKSLMGEYASGVPRSSWGGTLNNPYDTERSPMGSSSGSGTAVAANLVTAAIAEESGTSIRGPAVYNNLVGLAATQELVSRHGMVEGGINTRVGPITRTVADTAKILQVIAGYDPLDPMTSASARRLPPKPYASYTGTKRLDGIRIGVMREYTHRELFTEEDTQALDLFDKAVADLKALGATIVDPGKGDLLTPYLKKNFYILYNPALAKKFPELFPVDDKGKPTTDRTATVLDMTMDPSKVPALTIRDLGNVQAPGQSKHMLGYYLRMRGDASIKTITDLYEKAVFFKDERFGDRKSGLVRKDKDTEIDNAARIHIRYAVQYIVLNAMADLNLDVIVSPTNNIPAPKLGSPRVPVKNGRPLVWSFLGAQGLPNMTVPAGFTTQVYDRVVDPTKPRVPVPQQGGEGGNGETEPDSKLTGPFPAALPVGIDFLGRPFDEPTILSVASAYEAATHHRRPPADFGPLKKSSAASQ